MIYDYMNTKLIRWTHTFNNSNLDACTVEFATKRFDLFIIHPYLVFYLFVV